MSTDQCLKESEDKFLMDIEQKLKQKIDWGRLKKGLLAHKTIIENIDFNEIDDESSGMLIDIFRDVLINYVGYGDEDGKRVYQFMGLFLYYLEVRCGKYRPSAMDF